MTTSKLPATQRKPRRHKPLTSKPPPKTTPLTTHQRLLSILQENQSTVLFLIRDITSSIQHRARNPIQDHPELIHKEDVCTQLADNLITNSLKHSKTSMKYSHFAQMFRNLQEILHSLHEIVVDLDTVPPPPASPPPPTTLRQQVDDLIDCNDNGDKDDTAHLRGEHDIDLENGRCLSILSLIE